MPASPPAQPTPAAEHADAARPTRLAKPAAASGPQRALAKLGLRRDIDLALHLPLRYEDDTRLTPIRALQDGATALVEGVVVRCEIRAGGRRQLVVQLQDNAGDTLLLRFLHFYASQQKTLAAGTRLRVRGEPRGGFFGREMVHPVCKPVTPAVPLAATLTPIYPASAAVPQLYLRKAIAAALRRADLGELIPLTLLPGGVPALGDAVRLLHAPPPGAPCVDDRSQPAWRRIKFEELLAQQLSQLQARHDRATQQAPALTVRPGGLPDRLLGALPFTLTAAQRRVADEIAADLGRTTPMHRLLQGDVGSGKTVVAALAAAVAVDAGRQCALMAPTELLAEQHFQKLAGWLAPLGVGIAWLTGSTRGKARRQMLALAASGEAGLVVGTHAVIQGEVEFARLGLAVIDEQHRFGVQQRLALRSKAPVGSGEQPHLLMMSATPIPRTLAMTAYADLDVSTIDELPPGRTPVVTKLFADAKRDAVVARLSDVAAGGGQAYWVCPLIEESEHVDLRDATAAHAQLAAALPGRRVELLHGRLAAVDKAAVMAAFVAGDVHVLVSTTVIEVGVDVPNASLMVIDHAERFGLAQLHQLRGRVGRGSAASACVLLYSQPLSDAGRERLKAMAETSDGFEIARRDLGIRGPGEFMGDRQSGAALLRYADPEVDVDLLRLARRAAETMLDRHADAAQRHVQRWLGAKLDYLSA